MEFFDLKININSFQWTREFKKKDKKVIKKNYEINLNNRHQFHHTRVLISCIDIKWFMFATILNFFFSGNKRRNDN